MNGSAAPGVDAALISMVTAMNEINQTLYIPLYGKALVSGRDMILHDPKAEEIWAKEGFPLKGKSRSKWLAYYMSMRAAAFDRWAKQKMEEQPDAVVLHLGCGMDSRAVRVAHGSHLWLDVDFPEVIEQRKRYFRETESYRMVGADVMEENWLDKISGSSAIVVMEGISMYLPEAQLKALLGRLCGHFETVSLLMDCYTTFAAKASKVKNPINDVGVTRVYGLDDPKVLQTDVLRFVTEREMTPEDLIAELPKGEQWIFRKLYAGSVAKKMYRLYEYKRGK